jgi:hypothetical protein
LEIVEEWRVRESRRLEHGRSLGSCLSGWCKS